MIIDMRTTVILEDAVLREAKRRAAERHVTLSEIVNEALREAFRRRPAPVTRFSLITYGRSGRRVQHEPSDFAAALEDEDRARLR